MVATMVHGHAAILIGSKAAGVIGVLIIVVVFRVRAGGASMLGPPAIATRKDVLDTFISRELRGLARPRCCEGPTI